MSGSVHGSLAAYDLFVVYAEADAWWAEGQLVAGLEDAGLRCVTRRRLPWGRPYLAGLEEVITSSRATVLVLSPALSSDPHGKLIEQLAAEQRLDQDAPVFAFMREEYALTGYQATLVGALDRRSIPAEEAIGRICQALGQPVAGQALVGLCPYPGMRAFGADDALFFGRDEEVSDLVLRVSRQGLLVVIGPSGVGKSSLLEAGVARECQRRGMRIARVRLGATPAKAIDALVPEDLGARANALAGHRGSAAGSRLVVLVDPLEELFAPAVGREVQDDVCRRLKWLAGQPDVCVLMALRADFYGRFMASVLWPVEDSERKDLGPLRGDALEAAIRTPAADRGVYFEPVLLARLVSDVEAEVNALPFLQDLLVELWHGLERRTLTQAAFERLGGTQEGGLVAALASRANGALTRLKQQNDASERIVRRVFLRLVDYGEGRPQRRQQRVTELRDQADPAGLFDEVLERLTSERLVTRTAIVREGATVEPAVDLSHEALIVAWKALRDWLVGRESAELKRRRLLALAQEWHARGRKDRLLDESRLVEAETWIASAEAADVGVDDVIRDHTTASRRRLIRSRAKLLGGIAVGFGLVAALAVVALATSLDEAQQRKRAEDSELEAQRAKHRAEEGQREAIESKEAMRRLAWERWARELASLAVSSVVEDPNRALLLAAQASSAQADARSTDALIRALDQTPGLVRALSTGEPIADIKISADGRKVFALTESGVLFGWDATTWVALPGSPWPGPELDYVPRVRSTSRDGTKVLILGGERTLLWEPQHGKATEWNVPNSYADASITPDFDFLALSFRRPARLEIYATSPVSLIASSDLPGPLSAFATIEMSVTSSEDRSAPESARTENEHWLRMSAVMKLPAKGFEPSFTPILFTRPRGRAIDVRQGQAFFEPPMVASCGADRSVILNESELSIVRHSDNEVLSMFEPSGVEPGALRYPSASVIAATADCRTVVVGTVTGKMSMIWLDSALEEARSVTLGVSAHRMSSVALAPDEEWLVAGGEGGVAIVMATPDAHARRVRYHYGEYRPDSERSVINASLMVAQAADDGFYVWDRPETSPHWWGHGLPGSGRTREVGRSQDGRFLAYAVSWPGGSVGLALDLRTPEWRMHQVPSWVRPRRLAVSNDGLLAWSDAREVIVWDAEEGVERSRVTAAGCTPEEVVLAPHSPILAASCKDKRVVVWDLVTRQTEEAFVGVRIFEMAVLEAGPSLIVAKADMSIDRWWFSGPNMVKESIGREAMGFGLAMSPNGERIAIGVSGGVQVWDLVLRQRIGEPIHVGETFSSTAIDDDCLLVSEQDSIAYRQWVARWELDPAELRKLACARVGPPDAETLELLRDPFGVQHDPCAEVAHDSSPTHQEVR